MNATSLEAFGRLDDNLCEHVAILVESTGSHGMLRLTFPLRWMSICTRLMNLASAHCEEG